MEAIIKTLEHIMQIIIFCVIAGGVAYRLDQLVNNEIMEDKKETKENE